MKRKKNEKCKESQITTTYIFGFKLYFARKDNLKKSCLYHQILQFLCVAIYLKHSNDAPNMHIHKYTNHNIIEIYRNRLSTKTQIFIKMDYLIMMSQNYLYFIKRKKTFGKDIFYPPNRSN